MEQRVRFFQELTANPWFSYMNWVLDELRTPPSRRPYHYELGHCFYNLPRSIFMKRRLGKGIRHVGPDRGGEDGSDGSSSDSD